MTDEEMYNKICDKLGFKIEDYKKYEKLLPKEIYEDEPVEDYLDNTYKELTLEECVWMGKYLGLIKE